MQINPEYEHEVRRLLNTGQRKQAIEYLQNTLNVSQSEAERLTEAVEYELRTESVQRQEIFQRLGGTFGGCGSLALKMISFAFGFVAFSFLAGSIFAYFALNHFTTNAIRVHGAVIELRQDDGGDYAPVVEFSIDGSAKQLVGKITSSNPAYSVGDAVEVLVNPDNHNEAVIDTFKERWLIPVIIGCVSVFFVMLTIVSYVIGKKIQTTSLIK
jgi:hypothetical protein